MSAPKRGLRAAVLLMVAVFVLGLAACGDDDDDDTTSTGNDDEPAAATDVDLVKDGALTICTDTPYVPFEFEEDGEQTGFDIDLVRGIADQNSLDVEVKDLPFDGILGSLAAGDCDLVASAVTITDERDKQVDFTDPYFDADQSLLIRTEDADAYKTLDDLAGKTIGVQSGTTGEAYAQDHTPEGATLKSFEDADGLFGGLASKDIDAVLQDYPVNAYRATQDTSFEVTETFQTNEEYGFAVEQGNTELLDVLNAGLQEMRDAGDYDELYAKYFGEEES